MQKFLSELQRRKVLRVATGYVVAGWIILQVALALQAAMSLPPWFSSVVVAVLLVGFPVAAFASWFFEFTPDGIRRTAPSDEIVPLKFQATDLALAAALVLVLAAVTVKVLSPAPEATVAAPVPAATPAPSAASIAVLPFADLSPAKDQAYFSDGMAEEILNVLAKVKGLDVASRTSSFQFKGQEIGVPEIAKKLSVRHVLEGSVRKAGTTVRITAQLIDTATDKHLWSETYDRPLSTDNIFAIQDEIAQAIVKALNETMGTAAPVQVSVKPVTDNLTAYDLYLQARPLYLARVNLDKADELLTRAVEQDPNFAEAWEMHAAMQSLKVEYEYATTAPEDIEKRTIEFANRALAINPKSATAIAVLAKLKMNNAENLRRPADFETIIAELRQAIAYDPRNASAFNWLGGTYNDLGKLPSALESFDRCLEIDPYYAPCWINQIMTLSSLGRDAEALAAYWKMLDRGAASIEPPFLLLSKSGMEHEFKILSGSRSWLLGWRRQDELYDAYRHPERDHTELIADIRRFSRASKQISDAQLAYLLFPIGGGSELVDSLVSWHAELTRYRASPQFRDWIRKSGVYDYWRKHGFPPQCKPVGNDDFACD